MGTQFVDAQKTEISISAVGDFGEMEKTATPTKSRRVGRYALSALNISIIANYTISFALLGDINISKCTAVGNYS